METRLLINGEQVAGEGDLLAVENPATEETIATVALPSLGREGLEAFQETKHVHIETEIAAKEWWYPFGEGEPPASPPHGA